MPVARPICDASCIARPFKAPRRFESGEPFMNAVAQGHTASTSAQLQPVVQHTAEPLLQVRGVSLEYRTPERVVRATHQVSFEVDPADRFVLLGPSGCGKSTLLKAVAGFIQPR
ncbi:ABC transporter ATP-binding protein, partial [Pseudomonas coronafaciens pv. garcae]